MNNQVFIIALFDVKVLLVLCVNVSNCDDDTTDEKSVQDSVLSPLDFIICPFAPPLILKFDILSIVKLLDIFMFSFVVKTLSDSCQKFALLSSS